MSLSYEKWFGADNALRLNRDSTSTAGVLKIGTAASPYALGTTADRRGARFNFATTATTGTARGVDTRLWLSSGSGGEAIRAYCFNGSTTPADTCNGAHISLGFGGGADDTIGTVGNITGLGNAVRCTVMVPARTIGGTVSGVMGELWAESATSNMSHGACFRACIDGANSTGKALLEDNCYLFDISTGTNATGNMVSGATTADVTTGSSTHKIRIIANGTVMYLLATLA